MYQAGIISLALVAACALTDEYKSGLGRRSAKGTTPEQIPHSGGHSTMAKTYSAGVKKYGETYWMPDYTPKDTDILAPLKMPPSPGYRAKKRPLPWRQSPRPVPGPRSGPTFSPTWIVAKAAPLGKIDIMRDSYIREDRSRGIFFLLME